MADSALVYLASCSAFKVLFQQMSHIYGFPFFQKKKRSCPYTLHPTPYPYIWLHSNFHVI